MGLVVQMKINNIIKILFIITIALIISCNTDPATVRFDVISYGGSFAGYYRVDDEDIEYFDENDTTLIKGFYEYSKSTEPSSQLTVYAFPEKAEGNTTAVTYLSIQIYQDGKLVEQKDSQSSPVNETLYLIYTLSEETE